MLNEREMRERQYSCGICDATFMRKQLLTLHVTTHSESDERPHNTTTVCASACVRVCVCLFVCLFDGSNQSVLTTIGSGLQGPQGPSSTHLGDWDLLFI